MPILSRPIESRPRWQRKIIVFTAGIKHAVLNDFNVGYKVCVAIVALLLAGYWFRWIDFLLILVATAQVIYTELFNHAIEGVCDFIQPRQDEKIKIIKDVAAAAASIAMLVWVIVILVQLVHVVRTVYDMWYLPG